MPTECLLCATRHNWLYLTGTPSCIVVHYVTAPSLASPGYFGFFPILFQQCFSVYPCPRKAVL